MSDIHVETGPVPGQQEYEEVFPLGYFQRGDAVTIDETRDWIRENRDRLIDEVGRHGAVLFRGFPIRDANDFDALIREFGMSSFTYQESLSNAVRVNCTELVFTANEAPPDVSIYLHHEMAQTPLFPSRLFFCCETAPEVNGQTPICRSDVVLRELREQDPEFVAKCEQLGVRYINVMPAIDDPESGQGRSWKSTLDAKDASEAEARLDKLGYSYEWLEDGSLRVTTAVLPAVRTLSDGRKVFFNQLIAAYRGWQDTRNEASKSICFGDGSEIPPASMDRAIEISDRVSFDLAWQAGDMVILDNFLVMHGRRPFKGKRRVLASLVADDGSLLAA